MESEVIFTELVGRRGSIGLITLNRPKMLNALTQEMCVLLYDQLQHWQQVDAIKAIVIQGAGDRAFCAGGDIRNVYALREQPEIARQFFWHEYRLNCCIYHLKKPYIALMNGLTMGGGAGLSINGRFRVATEKLSFAMPETGIGFFPDVGGSFFLPRCRDFIGRYLALTGATINAADALYAGLVDAQILSEHIPDLLQKLQAASWHDDADTTVNSILQSFALAPTHAELSQHATTINACFAQTTISSMISCLQQQQDAWFQNVVKILASRSPLSLSVVLEQLRRGEHLDFDDCMRMEYRLANHFLLTPDFFEGIRAAVIDKDRQPRWQPSELAAVSAQQVAWFFEPVKEDEL